MNFKSVKWILLLPQAAIGPANRRFPHRAPMLSRRWSAIARLMISPNAGVFANDLSAGKIFGQGPSVEHKNIPGPLWLLYQSTYESSHTADGAAGVSQEFGGHFLCLHASLHHFPLRHFS